MRYWENNNKTSSKQEVKEISKENIMDILSDIKCGYLPDWNYSMRKTQDDEPLSLPDKYYPLHMAMSIAIKAVQSMDDDFFKTLEQKENKKSAN